MAKPLLSIATLILKSMPTVGTTTIGSDPVSIEQAMEKVAIHG